jgi:hypothetical protein
MAPPVLLRSDGAERAGVQAPSSVGSFAQVSRTVDERGQPVALKTVRHAHNASGECS